MFTKEQIEKAVKAKGYKWFPGDTNYNVNIVGVRCNINNKVTNTFDDILTLTFNKDGQQVFKQYNISTDPGLRSLKELLNVKGCAVLVPGQYSKCFMIGLHKGQYKALVQCGDVSVYRDKDKDVEYDLNKDTIETGLFGINIHKSGENSTIVDNWSAGCQVFKKAKDFTEFMGIIEKASLSHGNKFTYTLLNQSDIK